MSDLGWRMIFDGWAPIIRTGVLGTLAYAGLVLMLRISGKRTLSKMNAFDFVVTVALGSTLASILTSSQVSLLQGGLALGLLISLQMVNTLVAVHWPWYQQIIKAQPTLIFFRGQFLSAAMRRQRVTEEEVIAAMRQQGVSDPQSVDAVVMETEGSLSVLKQDVASPAALQHLGVDTEGQFDNEGQLDA